ncbi:hypothetical protein Neosp_002500 [[Neocosmospora] mangrovei]
MEPTQAQQNQPIPADSIRRNYTAAQEASPAQRSKRLPICQEEARQEFRGAHRAGRGGTGCGKTTQVSQFILFDEWKSGLLVACTQPRVIAATSEVWRVAQELDVELGDEVGYAVRFDNTSNDRTRVKFLTDSILLQELRSDRELSRYACVIVDEAHERTKNTDLLLALLKQAMGMRPDLKVVVMSATIDLTTFTRYFPGSNMFHAQGHAYPVQIQYLREATPDYRKAVLETIAYVAHTKPEGSILVFMASVQETEETEETCGLIRKSAWSPGLASLLMECVMDTKTGRKCIVSMNVDEDGLTIDGVRFVIANTPPGMLKSEVMAEILVLKSYGFHKISDFNFVDGPHAETLLRALYELRALGYIDADAKLTTKRSMAVGMPMDPAWYNAFLEAENLGCLGYIVTIACLSSTQDDIIIRPNVPRYAADVIQQQYSDAQWCRMSFINPKVADQVLKMRNSLMTSVSRRMLDNEAVPALEPSDPDFDLKIRQSLAAGFHHKAAHLDRRGAYKTVHDNQSVAPEPDSCLVGEKKEWAIYNHVSFVGVQYMRYVAAIDPDYGSRAFPGSQPGAQIRSSHAEEPRCQGLPDRARATRASRSS